MNYSDIFIPARVSGVRGCRRCPGNGLALTGTALRVDSADGADLLYYLRAQIRDAHDRHHCVVLVDLHDLLLDLVFRVRRYLAGRDGPGTISSLMASGQVDLHDKADIGCFRFRMCGA